MEYRKPRVARGVDFKSSEDFLPQRTAVCAPFGEGGVGPALINERIQ
jgi:hypothetical protein